MALSTVVCCLASHDARFMLLEFVNVANVICPEVRGWVVWLVWVAMILDTRLLEWLL